MNDELLPKKYATWKLITGITGSLLAAGFTVGVWLYTHFASAEELTRHERSSAKAIEKIDVRLGAVELESAATKALQRNLEEDFHWQREMTQRIADRVGAVRVPEPRHTR